MRMLKMKYILFAAFLLSADVHYMFPVTACPALPVIFSLLIMFIVTLL